jgi:crotonobetainyl-CoA:carnitine CoA-transferase CaiB-like acyl-CoA transferase
MWQRRVATLTRAEVLHAMKVFGVTATPVNSVNEALCDAQVCMPCYVKVDERPRATA